MRNISWLCSICVFLAFHGSCLGAQDSIVAIIDGDSIKCIAPPGYCVMPDEITRSWYERASEIGLAIFYPCNQSEDVAKGELNNLLGYITIDTEREPKLRNFKMSRKQFIHESCKLIYSVVMGEKRTKYYGDQQISEDFERPTPFILSSESDEYGAYSKGVYLTEENGNTITKALQQVVATTLIKGKTVTIRYYETDYAQNKSKMMLKRLKRMTKAIVEANTVATAE